MLRAGAVLVPSVRHFNSADHQDDHRCTPPHPTPQLHPTPPRHYSPSRTCSCMTASRCSLGVLAEVNTHVRSGVNVTCLGVAGRRQQGAGVFAEEQRRST